MPVEEQVQVQEAQHTNANPLATSSASSSSSSSATESEIAVPQQPIGGAALVANGTHGTNGGGAHAQGMSSSSGPDMSDPSSFTFSSGSELNVD